MRFIVVSRYKHWHKVAILMNTEICVQSSYSIVIDPLFSSTRFIVVSRYKHWHKVAILMNTELHEILVFWAK
jgi:hypothetical protein